MSEIVVGLAGRDHLQLNLQVDAHGLITHAQLRGLGCPELMRLVAQWRPRLTGQLHEIATPEGEGHADLLMRELIWRAQGKWAPPYRDEEICHCRSIATHSVDEAIVAGAHTPQEVSRQTSASTGCGTCRPNVEEMIAYRLRR